MKKYKKDKLHHGKERITFSRHFIIESVKFNLQYNQSYKV